MRYVPAFNPTSSPVLIDGDGRQIAGREWGVVDTTAIEVVGAPVGSIEKVVTHDAAGAEVVTDRVRDEPAIGAAEVGALVLRPDLLDRDLGEDSPAHAAVCQARDANKPAKAQGAAKKAAAPTEGGDTPPVDETQE